MVKILQFQQGQGPLCKNVGACAPFAPWFLLPCTADSGNHDISFGISDGVSFIGFVQYSSVSPCYKLEGQVVSTLLQNVQHGNGPVVTSKEYSSEIKIQIKPTEKWGSCFTVHDVGYVNTQDYQHSLDLSKALHFEIYRQDIAEKYHIKYIAVDVDLD